MPTLSTRRWRAWALKNPEREFARRERSWIKQKHGMTPEQYAAVKGDVCELCGGTSKLHLDHDHVTNVVRGTLCFSCNLSLGRFGDSEEGILRVLAYLRKTRPTVVVGDKPALQAGIASSTLA